MIVLQPQPPAAVDAGGPVETRWLAQPEGDVELLGPAPGEALEVAQVGALGYGEGDHRLPGERARHLGVERPHAHHLAVLAFSDVLPAARRDLLAHEHDELGADPMGLHT